MISPGQRIFHPQIQKYYRLAPHVDINLSHARVATRISLYNFQSLVYSATNGRRHVHLGGYSDFSRTHVQVGMSVERPLGL